MHITKDLVAASATPLVLGILTEGESYGYAILKQCGRKVHSSHHPAGQRRRRCVAQSPPDERGPFTGIRTRASIFFFATAAPSVGVVINVINQTSMVLTRMPIASSQISQNGTISCATNNR
jgi:hypothetical protein